MGRQSNSPPPSLLNPEATLGPSAEEMALRWGGPVVDIASISSQPESLPIVLFELLRFSPVPLRIACADLRLSLPASLPAWLRHPPADSMPVMMAAGHSSILMSMRYVHLSNDSIQNTMERLGGYKTGYKPQQRPRRRNRSRRQVISRQRNKWWAVQDSNLRPPACKAGALTN